MLLKHVKDLRFYINSNKKISIEDIFTIIGKDSHLIAIIIFSFLNIALAPLPVNSFVLGIPLIFLSFLYCFNIEIKSFELKFFRKNFDCVSWHKHFKKINRYTKKIENFTKRRWKFVFLIENRLFSGFSLLILAIIIFLPIPFANTPGSIIMIFIAIGIMQKDGLFLALGYLLAIVHFALLIIFKNQVLMLFS